MSKRGIDFLEKWMAEHLPSPTIRVAVPAMAVMMLMTGRSDSMGNNRAAADASNRLDGDSHNGGGSSSHDFPGVRLTREQ
ncbi:DUF768 domain-containing protein [Mesorhizobium caraganae]|uniref:DUF768 domain-containing protein n=1 Tax=Mesorhizobium caraganae TaxID=483206 RepID=UPI00177AF44A|nr:DUF768 domain-containing protein [Mesorhizobium caraganae]